MAMRLAGIVHSSPVTGNVDVYIELADLTVILGANDSGKTRTLVALHEVLRGLRPRAGRDEGRPPLGTPPFEATLFVELTDEEASFVSTCILQDLAHEGLEPSEYAIGSAEFSQYDPTWLDALVIEGTIPEDTAGDAWLELVRRSADLRDSRFDPLFEALSSSRLMAVRPTERLDAHELHLALPADLARSGPLRSLLEELGFELTGDAPDAPVVVVFYGMMQRWSPAPMWVPNRGAAINDEVLSAVGSAVTATAAVHDLNQTQDAGNILASFKPEGAPLAALAEQQEMWATLLLDSSDDGLSASVAPSFIAYCGIAQMVANEVLPDFVKELYWVSIEPAPIATWHTDQPVRVLLESRDGQRRFPLADAAEGLQLWLQLGVLEGAVAVRRLAAFLHGQVRGGWSSERWAPILDRLNALTEQRQTRRGLDVNPDFRLAALGALELVGADQWFVELPVRSDSELLARGLDFATLFGGTYCYFIDEPERHLHPSLAREAAEWLAAVMEERQTQCIVTTHSVPFLELGPDVAYYYLWRTQGRVFAHRFPVQELDAFSLIAEEMGFDRGELLTRVRQLLFVEGRADQIVLQTLLGAELRRLGVAIIPMHGAGRLFRVVEAEALFQYTAASIRVLVDNDVAALVPDLRDDAVRLEAALKDTKNTELQAVAQLLKTARVAERDVGLEVLSIPAHDMLFMLDEGVLRESFPNYPGHAEAERQWRQWRERTSQNIGLKRFCREHFATEDDVAVFQRVAKAMKERGLIPDELAAITHQLEA
jgi:energy-coupling factor transporter ATP-binding protein EcfA2